MNRILLALAALTITSSPLAAGIPQFRAWDICTPGSFRVCTSTSISLDWRGDHTRIVVTISNLQGLAGHELDDIGGVYWAGFTNIVQEPHPIFGTYGENYFSSAMELEGAGVEATPYSEFSFIPTGGDRGTLVAGPVAGVGEVIWGCSGELPGWSESYLGEHRDQPSTCGGSFVLTVDFGLRYTLTPETMPALGVYSLDPRVTTCGNWETDPSCVSARMPATPVPEPATVVLMASGLALVGVGALRRRRKAA